ncbi:DUF1203 domain-containing protein [uncultured Litoreibacter sp.]|uniref:DUF1203 domain-containing protein n=1 Tax=uncultured Litoreibacter sp. TaxID=1392394 RepID=UPI0026260462|nr:DUF1203 domain-containing protein [uncultured Litoreibacter sp.]
MTFQIHGLPAKAFEPLFDLSDAELAKRQITRCNADADQGYPCRITLSEAAKGDALLLLNFEHLPFATPYRASHAIYVSEGAQDRAIKPGEIPQSLKFRPLSLRAFKADGYMNDADLADQDTVSEKLTEMLSDPSVAFVHIHNAKHGCYAALATRSGEFETAWRGQDPHGLAQS